MIQKQQMMKQIIEDNMKFDSNDILLSVSQSDCPAHKTAVTTVA